MRNSIKMVSLLLIVFSSYGGAMKEDDATCAGMEQILTEVSKKKIFFGHQSVGNNIIGGISRILESCSDNRLVIKETSDANDLNLPIFAHARLGRNLDPKLKCDEFKRVLDSGIGNQVDVAMLKFCYADIDENTNIKEVFKYYRATFLYLEKKYPRVRFIHLTVPVTVSQNPLGLKARIKRLFRKELYGEKGNVNRNKFNALLTSFYNKNNLIFDLAKIEATKPDGSLNIFKAGDGYKYYVLVESYSDDGEHLNYVGGKIVAKELLKFITE